MSTIEQEIIETVKRLDEAQKQRVLDFVREIEVPLSKSYTLEELKKLPPEVTKPRCY